MARWKSNGGKFGRKNHNGITMTAQGEEGASQPMLKWTDDQDGDFFLRPALRFAIVEEKQQDRRVAIMTLVSFLLLLTFGICIFLLVTRSYASCNQCHAIENAMNLSVDPCDNFYEYSCGNWVTHVTIPEGYSRWGSFGQVASQNLEKLRKLLEEDGYVYNGTHCEALRKAKDYYRACMNESAIEEAGSLPLKQLINRLGGWSMVPTNTPGLVAWDGSSFDLTQAVIAAHSLSSSPLFQMFLSADEKNSSARVIQFMQSGNGMSAAELYSDNDTTHEEAYASLGAKVVVLLSLTDAEMVDVDNITQHPTYAPSLQRMREIVEFETNLTKIFVPKMELLDPSLSYWKTTLKTFDEIIPQIDMSHYLNEIFATSIPLEEEILIPSYSYFVKLNELLRQTDKRLLADYIMWHAVYPLTVHLPKIYDDIRLQYSSIFSGSNTSIPLWKNCVGNTDDVFSFVTGALFVKEVVTPQLINETEDLAQYIQDTFIANLPSVTWMDNVTKEAAKEKALAIHQKIGFPAWIEDPAELDQHYEYFNVTVVSCFDNALNLRNSYLVEMRKHLHTPVDKTEWHMGPAEVNAYYSSSFNEMVMPSGILQPPFHDISRPMSMNFGAMGMVMGHEMTHGFDNHGREFDKDGNMRAWWGNSSVAAYENQTDCMVDQYSSYKIGDSYLDGEFTLAENIADNGGLKIAYQAYLNWRRTHNETMGALDRMGFTFDQLFFLGFSQIWCSFTMPQLAELSIFTNSHSAERHRVNGVVSNMPEFANVYNCSPGSPMNPVEKCSVW